MKKDIQPKVYTDCVVTCACGNNFITTSTQKSITVDICSACHPFFTGQQKFVDTEGRIDKFEKKAQLMKQRKEVAEEIKKAKQQKNSKTKVVTEKPSLKELFSSSQN